MMRYPTALPPIVPSSVTRKSPRFSQKSPGVEWKSVCFHENQPAVHGLHAVVGRKLALFAETAGSYTGIARFFLRAPPIFRGSFPVLHGSRLDLRGNRPGLRGNQSAFYGNPFASIQIGQFYVDPHLVFLKIDWFYVEIG